MDKHTLRKEFKRKRENFGEKNKINADLSIEKAFFQSFLTEKQSFFIYLDFNFEVSTKAIIKKLLAQNKQVYLPKIFGSEIRAVKYSELKKHPFGFLEPKSDIFWDGEIEVALVPLLAATDCGARLGYGGGFYDKFFLKHSDIIKVGICYDFQITSILPQEPHDIKLDYILTENRFINTKGRKIL